MNKKDLDVLYYIFNNKYKNQREIAEQTGYSLGTVNAIIKELKKMKCLSEENQITRLGKACLEKRRVNSAIILAAGYGMRMVPINREIPKAFLEVRGEKLIERIIEQLQGAQIYNIYIVAGFMKEKFEYLIDKYKIKLIVNEQYATKNNLHSLFLTKDYIENTYIVPGDLWCEMNPFCEYEMHTWYMVTGEKDEESTVKIGKQGKLCPAIREKYGNRMIGIAYIERKYADMLRQNLTNMDKKKQYSKSFWEEALFENTQMKIWAKLGEPYNIKEINTYEELRDLDNNSAHLRTDAIEVICHVFKTEAKNITNIKVLKKGMTNRSFLFRLQSELYIMRIPGEGTEKLINRNNEHRVYQLINDKKICDEIIYLNAKNGYKISKFIENARTCNPKSKSDVDKCMKKLKKLHDMNLKAGHTFDLFQMIEFYEKLWNGQASVYCDYEITKKNVYELKKIIDSCKKKYCLTHIDAVPDNFLIYQDNNVEEVRLIDWEYAGMQDPHVDLAMFSIYAGYERDEIDDLLQIYFEGQCTQEIKVKIYCYVAVCGLLWSNWCEYKSKLGIEFGEYALKQYRYAKQFYSIVKAEQGEKK